MSMDKGKASKAVETFRKYSASGKLQPLWIGLFLFSFASLATIYSLVVPPFESPDEVGHFYYIDHLIRTHTLPHQINSNSGEAHQPPLYYWIASLPASLADVADSSRAFRANPEFNWQDRPKKNINVGLHGSDDRFPYRGQVLALHLARGASILMGTASVAVILLLGWSLFPNLPLIGWLAASLTAFNPQFLFLSGVINNDNLLILLACLAWLQVVRTTQQPERNRNWIYLGILAGAGLLTKVNGLIIAAVAGLLIVYMAVRERSFRRFVRRSLEVSTPVILISGWWFIRNQSLYGDPLGWKIYTQIFAANQRQVPFVLNELSQVFRTQFTSFWGVFGWMNLSPPGWYFKIIFSLIVLGFVGWLVAFWRRQDWVFSSRQRRHLAWLLVIVLAQEVLILLIIQGCNASCYQGRYLFPAIGPAMILLSLGLVNIFNGFRRLLAPLLVLLFFTLAAIIPFALISPAYPSPAIARSRIATVPHKVDINFNHQIELAGYEFQTNERGKGTLTLYWQVEQPPQEDLVVEVRLSSLNGEELAQKAQIPGKKRQYSIQYWVAGDLISDSYLLNLSQPLPSNEVLVQVSVSTSSEQAFLPVIQDGKLKGFTGVFDLIAPPR